MAVRPRGGMQPLPVCSLANGETGKEVGKCLCPPTPPDLPEHRLEGKGVKVMHLAGISLWGIRQGEKE